MARVKPHFASHQQELLVNRRRFTLLNAILVVALTLVGGWYFFRGTRAAGVTCNPGGDVYAYGRAYNADSFAAAAGATISDNYGESVGVDPSSGNYQLHECSGFPFNINISYGNPNGWTGPSPANYNQVILGSNGYGKDFVYRNPPPTARVLANGQSGSISLSANQALTISWSTANNPTYCAGSGSWSGGKAGSGSENHTADTATVGSKSYTLSCSNADGSVASTVNVSVSPPPLPGPPSGLSASGTSQTSIHLAWSQGQAGSGASIAQNQIFLDGALINTIPAATAFDDSGLTCGTTHTYYVKAVDNYGQVSGPSGTASANTQACPGQPPPPAPPPTGPPPTTTPPPTSTPPSGTPPTSTGGGGTTTPTTKATQGGGAAAAPDTTPPTVPTNFAAVEEGTIIKLSWDASTDNSGSIRDYQIDRSLDNTNWQNIVDNYTDTSYSDLNAGFGAHYYYRLRAFDNSGNASNYTTVDITTNQFTANVTGASTIINSDDGLVKVEIAAASDSNLACTVALSTQNSTSLTSSKVHIISGPYALVCKTSSGDNVDQFKQPVKVTVTLGASQIKQYTYFKTAFYDSNSSRWSVGKAVYSSKAHTMTFSVTKPLQFAVIGSKRSGIAAYIWTVLVLLGVALGYLVLRLRTAQRAEYEAYIRRKYYNF